MCIICLVNLSVQVTTFFFLRHLLKNFAEMSLGSWMITQDVRTTQQIGNEVKFSLYYILLVVQGAMV